MSAVKIWIGPSNNHKDTLQIHVDGKMPYLISPLPELDLHHYTEWLIEELDYDKTQIEVINGWKKEKSTNDNDPMQ